MSALRRSALLLVSIALAGAAQARSQNIPGPGSNNPFTPSPPTGYVAMTISSSSPLAYDGSSRFDSATESREAATRSTQQYRIGSNDVVLIEDTGRKGNSRYLTARPEGNLVVYGSDSMIVLVGKTVEQIESELESIYRDSRFRVTVREYASQFAVVRLEGSHPIRIPLRRNATPLYLIRSEAGAGSDFKFVRLVRNGTDAATFTLADPLSIDQLIYPGDELEFFRSSPQT